MQTWKRWRCWAKGFREYKLQTGLMSAWGGMSYKRFFAWTASWRHVAKMAGIGPRWSRCTKPAVRRIERSSTPSSACASSASAHVAQPHHRIYAFPMSGSLVALHFMAPHMPGRCNTSDSIMTHKQHVFKLRKTFLQVSGPKR